MFKIFDPVECIAHTSLELTIGEVYTIKKVGNKMSIDYVYVEENDGLFPLLARSFKKL